MKKTIKIAFYTLGCKVNQYETLKLSEEFVRRGYEIADQTSFADVYVINSCTVTGIADKKSRNFARRSKRINPNAITALIGCYAEVAPDVLAEIQEIDIILGTKEKENLPDVLEAFLYKNAVDRHDNSEGDNKIPRLQERSRAYLKIQDGCDRFCSYCIIPYARGPVRSRPTADIISEAKILIQEGYKEIILTGINTALYGVDLYGDNKLGRGIIDIVNKISEIRGDFRIRISSLEPTVVDANCVKELIKNEKLCRHLHLSLQSGSDNILSAMKRRYNMSDYKKIVDVLKSNDSDFAISTDIIVGFPGEKEEDFEESLKNVKEIGFSKIHVFKYSVRSGTDAAEMQNQVSENEKNMRSKILIEEGNKAAENFILKNKGKTRQTLFFGPAEGAGASGGVDNSEILDKAGSVDNSESAAAKSSAAVYRGITDNDIEIQMQSKTDISNTLMDAIIK